MTELQTKVQKSIERLKAFEPPEGYYLAFSGGKDSVVCKALLDMAGCKYDAVYRVTSVDPPELVRFIKNQHPDVVREVPRDKDGKPITMWNLIPKKLLPPTRLVRYCCDSLKESGGDGRLTVTGVRWAESKNREKNQGIITMPEKKSGNKFGDNSDFKLTRSGGVVLLNDNDESRKLLDVCYKKHKTLLNPIIDWSDEDVWSFIKQENISYCSLYDEGFSRLGCIGCPLAKQKMRERELKRWPKYKEAYLKAFEKMIERRKQRHLSDPSRPIWKQQGVECSNPTPIDVFNWWMEYDVLPSQMNWFDEETEDDE